MDTKTITPQQELEQLRRAEAALAANPPTMDYVAEFMREINASAARKKRIAELEAELGIAA